jgi:hypothetical protein
MYSTLITLIDRLDSSAVAGADVIRWGCPVPSFGNISNSRVATLGINPSNREFVDESGNELQGTSRRFHTLNSLGLRSWDEVDVRHLHMILESCRTYFYRNPYNIWFNKLDQIISGTNTSFYDSNNEACHLDLIPFATVHKWTELTSRKRSFLLSVAGDTLGTLLRDSQIQILILNGMSVVQQFQEIAGVCLDRQEMPIWSLPRRSKPDVIGIAFKGLVDTISGIMLERKIMVIGFNHNLQSSFGVSTDIIRAIYGWVAQVSKEINP